jgi:hypothetical protein
VDRLPDRFCRRAGRRRAGFFGRLALDRVHRGIPSLDQLGLLPKRPDPSAVGKTSPPQPFSLPGMPGSRSAGKIMEMPALPGGIRSFRKRRPVPRLRVCRRRNFLRALWTDSSPFRVDPELNPSRKEPPRFGKKKSPGSFRDPGLKILATAYSRTSYTSTTIGERAFHFRVRDGNGWGHASKVTRVLAHDSGIFPPLHQFLWRPLSRYQRTKCSLKTMDKAGCLARQP